MFLEIMLCLGGRFIRVYFTDLNYDWVTDGGVYDPEGYLI